MPSDLGAPRRWLIDIQHHIKLAEADMPYEAFKDSDLHLYAVTRCLEIISEASRRFLDALKERHPSVAWQNMAAAGNIYRHEYKDVAASAVWRTLTHDLPLVREVVAQELAAALNVGSCKPCN